MSLLLVSLVLSAAPPVGLWERQSAGVPRGVVDTVALRLREALTAEALVPDTELGRCGSSDDCLVRRARERGGIAVGFSVARGRKGLLVDLQASAPDGAELADSTFSLPASGDLAMPEVDEFARKLAAAWRARAPAPAVVTASPPERLVPPAPALVEDEVPVGFWSGAPARITLVSGGVTVAAAIALGIAGAAVKGSLETSLMQQPPVLTRPQALEQAGLANGLLTGSLLSSILAGVSTAVLLILFGTSET